MHVLAPNGSGALLVCAEDLPTVHHLGEGYARILLPVLDSLCALDKDDIVVMLALVVDLDLFSVSASHFAVC